ncbi:MAG TPA: sigma-70 family RNA polymerase sigma factor [Vicinamibacterales bacterium]|nr:sigma-70 family RNA polymerase sigma factor [Vicinamibacterales bacterium]
MQHDHGWLAERFEDKRRHLHAVAYRMLGSRAEADDAVQDAWLRMSGAETRGVENLGGWMTTIVARVCLDVLRSRKSRREEPLETRAPAGIEDRDAAINPEHEALLGDAIGLAMLLVLDTLDPAERVAFVLHDMFDVPFADIAPIVGRSEMAARQLASRARRRVQSSPEASDADPSRQREVVAAFLAASRSGNFDALLSLLDPDVVLRADRAAVLASAGRQGAPAVAEELRGAAAVAHAFSGRARGAQAALIDGAAGAVWAPGGQPRAAFIFTIAGGRIAGIEIVFEPERILELDIAIE